MIRRSGERRCEVKRQSHIRWSRLSCFFLDVDLFDGRVGICATGKYARRTERIPSAGDPAAIAAGRTLYQQTCQACHGGEARGDRGPALDSGNFRHGGEDTDLFRTIRTGVPGTQMPAFPLLPADNVWRIITYLRSLNANSAAGK